MSLIVDPPLNLSMIVRSCPGSSHQESHYRSHKAIWGEIEFNSFVLTCHSCLHSEETSHQVLRRPGVGPPTAGAGRCEGRHRQRLSARVGEHQDGGGVRPLLCQAQAGQDEGEGGGERSVQGQASHQAPPLPRDWAETPGDTQYCLPSVTCLASSVSTAITSDTPLWETTPTATGETSSLRGQLRDTWHVTRDTF